MTEVARSGNTTYIQLEAPRDGVIALVGNTITHLTLYDRWKKPLKDGEGVLTKEQNYTNMFSVKAGTYYISGNPAGTGGDTYKIAYRFMDETTLAPGKLIAFAPGNMAQEFYVKVKATETGYISFATEAIKSGYITLCNKDKKELTGKCYIKAASEKYKNLSFAVKKGVTYFAKVQCYSDIFGFKYSIKKVTENSGTNTSGAVSIKKGKSRSGLILSGQAKKEYYKIKLTKAQIVKLRISGNVSSGSVTFTVYSDKKLKKKIGSTKIKGYGISSVLTSMKNKKIAKLSKGTYYIVVQRNADVTNATYKIEWLK